MAHHQSYSDDKSSMQSTYNSAGETSLTVFSRQQTSSTGSPYSSPPQSRDQSPVRLLAFRPKPQSPVLSSSLSNTGGHDQSVAVNAAFTDVIQPESALSKRNEAAEMSIFERGDCSMPGRLISTNNQEFLSLHTVGGMFDQPHDPTIGESEPFTCSEDSSDEDLDLEQSADKFLSEKFGISLSRLRRPNRIIYAFQQVKNQCVGILEDEGHQFVGSPCSDDSQSEPVDNGDTHHPSGADRTYSLPGNSFTSPGMKRPNHDITESDHSPGSSTLVKTRRYKKRRVRGDFSCPFRKRNPRRFNVRDHAEKHIAAHHYKKVALVCERCNQTYAAQDALVAHLEQCPHPPPNRPPIRYIDPEDGIDCKMEDMLKSRRSSDQINNWATLWGRLFPTDTIVPSPEFEPVVEDHDLVYTFRCSQSQILQRIDALDLGPASERVKASLFEEIERLLGCGGSHDQYPTPSSNTSTPPTQSQSRERDIATVERERDLVTNPLISCQTTEVANPEELGPPMPSGNRDPFGIVGVMEFASSDAILQPLGRYGPPMFHENQSFVGLPSEQIPFREITERTACLENSNIGLNSLQSPAHLQPELFYTGATAFTQNRFLQTPQNGPWVPNNGYSSVENDPAMEWSVFSGGFDFEQFNDTEC
ncbi:hypothetical protein F5Y12DRAFT_792514 [Xylaria sp. FL1777]|nr:hypothetical protein F5Y12DRAFT_792514 [Xylaria sp. FL1777]